jgi:hypothetical protein
LKGKSCDRQGGLTGEQQSLLAALAKAAAPAAARDIAVLSGLGDKVVSCGLKSFKERGYFEIAYRSRLLLGGVGIADSVRMAWDFFVLRETSSPE